MLILFVVGCNNNAAPLEIPEDERMTCRNVGDTVHNYIRRCEDETTICYTHSDAISCYKKVK